MNLLVRDVIPATLVKLLAISQHRLKSTPQLIKILTSLSTSITLPIVKTTTHQTPLKF